MRILILTHYYFPEVGAAQTRLSALAKVLAAQGHDVDVVGPMPNYPLGKIFPEFKNRFSHHEKQGRISIHRYWLWASTGKSFGRLFCYLSFMITCLFSVRDLEKPDLIYVNSGPLFLAIPGVVLAKIWRRPWVLNVSDLWPRSVEHLSGFGARGLYSLGLSMEKWAYKEATYINAITEGVRDILLKEKKVPAQKMLFLPNGVDLSFFSEGSLSASPMGPREKFNLQNKVIFIYPGNHGYAHALESVLAAAHEIEKKSSPMLSQVHFLLVGGGSEKEKLQQTAKELQLKNVTFADPIPFAELAQWIQASDIGLVHVRNTALASETRPAKMFPLMAGSKPIFYVGDGEGTTLLRQSGGGWAIASGDPVQMVRQIEQILLSRLDWPAMGAKNHQFVRENYSAETLVARWFGEIQNKLNSDAKA